MAILGPSGSGKTTLLYAVAGFLEIAEGSIEIHGRLASTTDHTIPPDQRDIGLVFQNYALWPHLTAESTVAYPIRRSGVRKGPALTRARRLLETVGIGELADRKPAEMSGGQQQRVGLARALARDAELYLFDEPTAHLDASVRTAVQSAIERTRRATGSAALYSTHDSAEALAIADRVAVIRAGTIIQVAAPQIIYERPLDVWAARLTGPASVFDVPPTGWHGGKVEVDLAGCRVLAETDRTETDLNVNVIVRPEWVHLGGPIMGEVTQALFRGPHTDYEIGTSHGTLSARLPGPPRVDPGTSTGWTIDRGWVASTRSE